MLIGVLAVNPDGIGCSSQSNVEEHLAHPLYSVEEGKNSKPGEKSKDEKYGLGIDNVWGGIPAKNHRGENLLLFIGIIDILQSYGMLKKVVAVYKYHEYLI